MKWNGKLYGTQLSSDTSYLINAMALRCYRTSFLHYSDVMGAMTSQITSLTIVYSTVYSGTDQRKHQSSAQRVSNAENASIWWRHYGPTSLSRLRIKEIKHQKSALLAHCDPVHGANMGPTWVLLAPDGPHVGPMNLAIRGGESRGNRMFFDAPHPLRNSSSSWNVTV